MAILTHSAVSKGTASTVTLNKTELAAMVVHSDSETQAFFRDSSNWDKVRIVYKSMRGVQMKVLVFNGQDASPQTVFDPSLRSRDMFQLDQAIIEDLDGGTHTIALQELPEEEKIVSLYPARVIAPTPTLVTVTNQTVMTVDSVSLLGTGYKVRLYKKATDTTSSEIRTIVAINGTVITLDAPFTSAVVAGDLLRFPSKVDCHIEQQYRFLFVE